METLPGYPFFIGLLLVGTKATPDIYYAGYHRHCGTKDHAVREHGTLSHDPRPRCPCTMLASCDLSSYTSRYYIHDVDWN